jgi:hypothetical protein
MVPRDSIAGKNLEPRANEARNDAKNSRYCEIPTLVCNAWAHKRKTAFHILKLEGCHGEILASASNTASPFESGKISGMNSEDKDFSSSIF